jgi:hypothetical protein
MPANGIGSVPAMIQLGQFTLETMPEMFCANPLAQRSSPHEERKLRALPMLTSDQPSSQNETLNSTFFVYLAPQQCLMSRGLPAKTPAISVRQYSAGVEHIQLEFIACQPLRHRNEIKTEDRIYQYRYSDLVLFVSMLMRDGWLTELDLAGLQQEKIATIKLGASL